MEVGGAGRRRPSYCLPHIIKVKPSLLVPKRASVQSERLLLLDIKQVRGNRQEETESLYTFNKKKVEKWGAENLKQVGFSFHFLIIHHFFHFQHQKGERAEGD